MKPLLDENLSHRLAKALSEIYPGSIALRDCSLLGASDKRIWQYAIENGFVIVSKDSDFAQRSFLSGAPPQVIWLRVGNCTTARAEFVLRNTVERLLAFEESGESCLILSIP